MGIGKSSGSNTYIPTLSPEQNKMIAAQTGLFTSQIAPSYATAVSGATDLYNQAAPGVTNAAQNLAGTANQAQTVLGGTGESALTSGINALQNLTSPEYQKAQMEAALAPAQAQYQQNLAGLNTQFGGAGQIGSAKQALAQQQLAGQTQAAQQQAAAQVLKDIASQQASAGSTLAQLGQAGLGGAQAAASNQITAAMTPQQLYNQYASVLFGTPQASYNPNFQGTQGYTSTADKTNASINLSDFRAKEKVEYIGTENGHKMYEFNYIDSPVRYKGVMAQDIEKYVPEAVSINENGYLQVDYSKLGVSMTEVKAK